MRFIIFFLLTVTVYAEVDFEKHIRPIFESKCTKCHGPEKDKGGLALHTRHHAFKETDSGESVIIAGKPENSLLYKKLIENDEDDRMPPKKPLSKEQIVIIKQWISEGAKWPDDGHKEVVNWSLKPIQKRPLPEIKNTSWPKNEIDYFTLAKMEKNGFKPSAAADPSTLLRRVYLDLTGQLPSVKELEDFEKNPSNYEKIVDSLLASKSYGEHWATHWLDLARYADSDGYQRDSFRQVWLFRDWVIKAVNEDKKFDKFTIEQLAGDLLPNPSKDQLIATGFNRGTTVNMEAGTDVEHDRIKQVMERVNVMGTVWLGSSLACSQCHNHKYDPFTMKDYYSFMAYFNNTRIETKMGVNGKGRNISYIGPNLKMFKNEDDEKQLQLAKKALSQIEKKYIAVVTSLEEAEKPPKKRMNMKQCKSVHKKKYPKNKKLNDMMADWNKANKAIKKASPVESRIMEELPKKRETRILLRGEHTNPGKVVTAAVPKFLHEMPQGAPDNRLGLAQWLVSKKNPLMPRAVVNRWWAEFFGKGISSTLEDLGKQGDTPTHPKLLDWLAADFTENWSRKALHRKIVMSNTYRQSSIAAPELLKKDPGNHLYSHMSPLRLKAETVRDTILQVSGLLSDKMYGPTVKPPQPPGVWRVIGKVDNTYKFSTGQDRYRKGIYTIWRRSAHYPSFANFDAPDRGACTVKRTRSNTPMQALTLLNDEAYVEAARAFARRIKDLSSATKDEDKLSYAFRLCTSRKPDKREMTILTDILNRERAEKNPKYDEWFTVATVLINMHETITRR